MVAHMGNVQGAKEGFWAVKTLPLWGMEGGKEREKGQGEDIHSLGFIPISI